MKLQKSFSVTATETAAPFAAYSASLNPAIKCVMQAQGGDVYIGTSTSQDFKIADGAGFSFEVDRLEDIYFRGTGTLAVLVFGNQ